MTMRIGTFSRANRVAFHRVDGSGYALLAEAIRTVDALNPLVAARLAGAFNGWRRIEPRRAALIPGFARVKQAALDNRALGSSISGAGPSVFGWFETREQAERAGAAMVAAFAEAGLRARAWISPVAAPGARLLHAGAGDN